MTERHASRPHPEHVVLDIGAEVGALIVHTDAELHGREIEISPAGRDHTRNHKDVLERPLNGRPTYAAVFDRLDRGSYTLWVNNRARTRVTITGANVTELDWRNTAFELDPK